MNENQTRVIEEMTFSAQPLSPFASLDLLPELSGLVGSGIGGASDAAMAAAVMRSLSAAKLRVLLPQLLQSISTTITEGGKPQRVTLNSVESINLVFQGRMKALPQVVAFALEVSFSDFLAGVGLAVEAAKAKKPKS